MLLSNDEYSACAFMIERMHRRMGGWPAALAAVETSICWDGETVSLSTVLIEWPLSHAVTSDWPVK